MTGNLRLGFHAPNTLREISDLVAEAANAKIPLEVRGRGSKYEVGRYIQSGSVVSTEHLVGISLYEPTERVMSAAAGTPLDDIRNILAEHGQQLAFEPIDLGPALGTHTGQSSIGGVFATNLSGSRRIQVGAARDHLLGVTCVNGWGEAFKSGGRVMKNVTGYDLCKAVAGSWGTLAVVTEVTMKVSASGRRDAHAALLRPARPDRGRCDDALPRHALRSVRHRASPGAARSKAVRSGRGEREAPRSPPSASRISQALPATASES